jgi:U3 small nucleolar RNA-associated protein 23
MRVNRNKLARRLLRWYRLTHGLVAPYVVYVDGNALHAACRAGVDIPARLATMLGGAKFTLRIAREAVAELEALGDRTAAARAAAAGDKFTIVEPRGDSGGDSAGDAIRAAARGEDGSGTGKIIVITQDPELRTDLRRIPGVPLIHISQTVLVMEPPSNASKGASAADDRDKSKLDTTEQSALDKIKRDRGLKAQALDPHKRLKKKAGGANPLSCKKRAKAPPAAAASAAAAAAAAPADGKKKRKRRRGGKAEAAAA